MKDWTFGTAEEVAQMIYRYAQKTITAANNKKFFRVSTMEDGYWADRYI